MFAYDDATSEMANDNTKSACSRFVLRHPRKDKKMSYYFNVQSLSQVDENVLHWLTDISWAVTMIRTPFHYLLHFESMKYLQIIQRLI